MKIFDTNIVCYLFCFSGNGKKVDDDKSRPNSVTVGSTSTAATIASVAAAQQTRNAASSSAVDSYDSSPNQTAAPTPFSSPAVGHAALPSTSSMTQWPTPLSIEASSPFTPASPITLPEVPTSPTAREVNDQTPVLEGRTFEFVTGQDPNIFVNFTERTSVFMFYEKDSTPLGALFWNTEGKKEKQVGNSIALHHISDVSLGKGNKILQSPSLASVPANRCLAFYSRVRHQHVSLIAPSDSAQREWVKRMHNRSTCIS